MVALRKLWGRRIAVFWGQHKGIASLSPNLIQSFSRTDWLNGTLLQAPRSGCSFPNPKWKAHPTENGGSLCGKTNTFYTLTCAFMMFSKVEKNCGQSPACRKHRPYALWGVGLWGAVDKKISSVLHLAVWVVGMPSPLTLKLVSRLSWFSVLYCLSEACLYLIKVLPLDCCFPKTWDGEESSGL